jgi:hypothetical protein
MFHVKQFDHLPLGSVRLPNRAELHGPQILGMFRVERFDSEWSFWRGHVADRAVSCPGAALCRKQNVPVKQGLDQRKCFTWNNFY